MENKEKVKKSLFIKRSIQEYIYLSYLYLLVLGTISYSIFYSFLGINIISYSNLLDILLSPIVILTKDKLIPGSLLVYTLLVFLLIYLIQKKTKKRMEKNTDPEKEVKLNKTYQSLQSVKIITPMIIVLGFYLGFAIAAGIKNKNVLENGTAEMDHEIEFSDGEVTKVKLIGLNSQYVFYVLENAKKVTISPISGNVKQIEEIH